MHLVTRRVTLIGLLSLAISVSLAATYKYTDDQGNVTYSGTPPADGRRYEKIQSPTTGSTTTEEAAPATATSPSTSSGSGSSDVLKKEQAKNEEIRRQNCDIAKKNLEAYTVFRRIKDKDGNVIILDDNERAKKIEESKKAVQEFCE